MATITGLLRATDREAIVNTVGTLYLEGHSIERIAVAWDEEPVSARVLIRSDLPTRRTNPDYILFLVKGSDGQWMIHHGVAVRWDDFRWW